MSRRAFIPSPLSQALLSGIFTYSALRQLDTAGRARAKQRAEEPAYLRDGVGPVVYRHLKARVEGSPHSAPEVAAQLSQHFPEYMPSLLSWVRRRRPRQAPIRAGEKLDIQLFLLRRAKVRVDDVTAPSFTIRTLRQHPDAGSIKISVKPEEGPPHTYTLCIESVVRSSDHFDRLIYRLGIKWLQHSNWEIVLQRALDYAGGQVIYKEEEVREYAYQS